MGFWEYLEWWWQALKGTIEPGEGGDSGGAGANYWWELEPPKVPAAEEWYGKLFGFWYLADIRDFPDGRQRITLVMGQTLEKFAKEQDQFRAYFLQPVLKVCQDHDIPLLSEEEDAMIQWMLDHGAPRDYAAFMQFLPAQVQTFLYANTDEWVLIFAWYASFLFDFVQAVPTYELDIEYQENLGDERFIAFAEMQVIDNTFTEEGGGMAPNYMFSSNGFGVELIGKSSYTNIALLRMVLWNDALINAQDAQELVDMRRLIQPALPVDPSGVKGQRKFFKARKQAGMSWFFDTISPLEPSGGTDNFLHHVWNTGYWYSYATSDTTWDNASFSPNLFHYLIGEEGLPAAYALALEAENVMADGSVWVPGGDDASSGQVPSASPEHEAVVKYARNSSDPSITALANRTEIQWYEDGRSGYLACQARWAQGRYVHKIFYPFPAAYHGAGRISIIPALTCLSVLQQGGVF